ncbi:alpha/beta hydrolase [Alloscardovia omnicolens]|uniref:alpha/beta hydrolase n=1 Tax=Alloscardovia omnicolens TaxID=419015 RepID=UPI003A67411E
MKNKKNLLAAVFGIASAALVAGTVIWRTPTLRLKPFRWIFESAERAQVNKPLNADDIAIQKDIAYIDDGNRGHLLDIYRLKDAPADAPTIIGIHGGGLFASYKEVNRDYSFEWVRKGYTVVNISYRRIPETTLWNQIHDCMSALQYLHENSEELGLNLDDSYLVGDSAGALLSLFVNSINESPELQKDFGIQGTPLHIKAMGLVSIMLETNRHDFMDFITPLITDDSDVKTQYYNYLLDPASIIAKTKLPPIFLVTGKQDMIQNETLKLNSILEDYGIKHALKNYPWGKKHILDHVFAIKNPKWEESQEVIELMSNFFSHNS